ncbi:protein translocase subunit SecD [Chlorobium phaeovibrioides]|uniref:Protein translocase subunit SecD n=2 Tax=Chlorobium phaeovibrioides TaxID=1094 RepID=A0A5M8IBF7_CHLPH|nr:protein translocase subunit SecD [Chlorobium phaeovibrioides]MWV54463.1 protein translocase subunit SecD [Chlorobium phaeovibrioides]QEQ56289.1 protein translocase subunit SecD [Chlorobium phaeovibrioides]HCD35711.1 protein translocase subunit SecD [Chlorobium sp.]
MPSMKNKRYNLLLIVGVTLLALWSLVPTWKEYSLGKQLEAFSSPRDSLNFVLNHRDEIEDARQKGLKLGLDLKGGMHLVMEVDQIDLFMQKAWNRDAKFDAIMEEVGRQAAATDADVIDLVSAAFRKQNIRLSRYFYDIRNSDSEIQGKLRKEAADALVRAREIIRNRIDQYGVAEPMITTQGNRKIIIELPGISDENRMRNLLKGTAKLEFRLLREKGALQRTLDAINTALSAPSSSGSSNDAANNGLYSFVQVYGSDNAAVRAENRELVSDMLKRPEALSQLPPDSELLLAARADEADDGSRLYSLYLVRKTPELTGGVITEAKATFGSQGVQPEVLMSMNSEGTSKWARITGANIGKRIAIVLDGAVYSAPVVQSKIPNGNSVINGIQSLEEAKDLEIVLKAGALPAPVRIVEERTVGPSLGADYIRAGLQSLIWGFSAVVVFMIFYYRQGGLAADVALVLNVLIVLSVLAGFNASLSLPGIAGIVLTMGMAVDANVLIYERIREELAAGRSITSALSEGYDRAFSSILDSHVTTLAAAFLLYTYGIGPIQGFAVTLMIGTAASLFTAIVVTREIFRLLVSKNLMSSKSFG